MNYNFRMVFVVLMCSWMLTSCKSEYTKYVERELATGIKNDSLIFGIKMGQTRKDFFSICWQLNKDKVLSHGNGNSTVKYEEVLDSTQDQSFRKDLLFYATFDENDTIVGMDMTYYYAAWAPWNKDKFSTTLADSLQVKFMKDYGGNPFLPIPLDNEKYKAFVKIDGNRQILIYPKDDKEVVVKIEDLNHKLKKK
jgi:hypothetical protein